MKKFSMLLGLLALGLSGCANDNSNSTAPAPGTRADNEEVSRTFTCSRAGDANSTSFTISGDNHTIELTTAGGSSTIYVRDDIPEYSDNQPGTMIEYRRKNSRASAGELKLSGNVVVAGANNGTLELGNNTFNCASPGR